MWWNNNYGDEDNSLQKNESYYLAKPFLTWRKGGGEFFTYFVFSPNSLIYKRYRKNSIKNEAATRSKVEIRIVVITKTFKFSLNGDENKKKSILGVTII